MCITQYIIYNHQYQYVKETNNKDFTNAITNIVLERTVFQ